MGGWGEVHPDPQAALLFSGWGGHPPPPQQHLIFRPHEAVGILLLGRVYRNNWHMIVGEVYPPPCSSNTESKTGQGLPQASSIFFEI